MDFTPHPRLRLGMDDAEEKNSDDKSFEIETKWQDGYHPFSILLMPRSLLIFKDELYSGEFSSLSSCFKKSVIFINPKNYMFGPEYLHGIKDSKVQHYEKVRSLCFLIWFFGENHIASCIQNMQRVNCLFCDLGS